MKSGVLLATVIALSSTAGGALADSAFLQKISPHDAAAGDGFGVAVSVSDGVAIIGAASNSDAGFRSGSAYIFRLVDGEWIEEAKLTASDARADEQFGVSVAIQGDRAVVGARFDGDLGERTGSIYVYQFDGVAWIEETELHASKPGINDALGSSVSIDADVIIAGADHFNNMGPGAAHIFRLSGNEWIEERVLGASDPMARDSFGGTVKIEGDVAIVGAGQFFSDRPGAAYIYRFDGQEWNEEAKLTAADGAIGDQFGASLDLFGNTVLIGARLDTFIIDADVFIQAGSAYIFVFNGEDWMQQSKMISPTPELGEVFGSSVALYGDVALVGVPSRNILQGAAEVYRFDGDAWLFDRELTAPDGEALDLFGRVAIHQSSTIIGAVLADDAGQNSGAAYAFDLKTTAAIESIDVLVGSLLEGGPDDLCASDDTYVRTRSGFGRTIVDLHHMQMRVISRTDVLNPVTIDLALESRISESAGIAHLSLLNHNTGELDPVATFPLTNTDQIAMINGIGAAEYINPQGEMEVGIKHVVFVPFFAFTFESQIDLIEITVTPK